MRSALFNRRFAQNFIYIPPLSRLSVGQLPPEVVLPDVDGKLVRLTDFRGKQPVVLAFTRIFTEKLFCPFCYPHIQALKTTYQTIRNQGAELLMISSTDVAQSAQIVADLDLPYPFLSDPSCEVFRRYGLGQALGAPLPGQFVVDKAGYLRFKHLYSLIEANAPETAMLTALTRVTLP